MKIISWNCNMAFRKKAAYILAEQPDILIVPECENGERLSFGPDVKKPAAMVWYGGNPHKGLGVFSYNNFKLKLLDIHNPEFKYVLPLKVYSPKISLTLFAIWAQKPDRHDGYVQQVWNAVHFYRPLLRRKNVILAGDFNSNSIWDKPKRFYNHTNLVQFLQGKKIVSAYHHFYNQQHGEEKHNTLFLHRKADRPYHIDYCFASANLIGKLKHVEIGAYKTWTGHSDHKPLIADFDLG